MGRSSVGFREVLQTGQRKPTRRLNGDGVLLRGDAADPKSDLWARCSERLTSLHAPTSSVGVSQGMAILAVA